LAFTKFEYDTEGKLTGHDTYVDCTKEGPVKFNEEWSSNESTVVCHNPEKFCAASVIW